MARGRLGYLVYLGVVLGYNLVVFRWSDSPPSLLMGVFDWMDALPWPISPAVQVGAWVVGFLAAFLVGRLLGILIVSVGARIADPLAEHTFGSIAPEPWADPERGIRTGDRLFVSQEAKGRLEAELSDARAELATQQREPPDLEG